MVSIYILRNIIERIPFPFDNYKGYNHSELPELRGSVIISIAVIAYQENLRKKTHLLIKKLELVK